jgi:hypothetical protein
MPAFWPVVEVTPPNLQQEPICVLGRGLGYPRATRLQPEPICVLAHHSGYSTLITSRNEAMLNAHRDVDGMPRFSLESPLVRPQVGPVCLL